MLFLQDLSFSGQEFTCENNFLSTHKNGFTEFPQSIENCICSLILFIYLFGFLHRFQHCTGHIMTGSWKGRGNHYIQFVRVLYCKLPTNGKQLPAFPLENVTGIELQASEVGGESVTTLPQWPLYLFFE